MLYDKVTYTLVPQSAINMTITQWDQMEILLMEKAKETDSFLNIDESQGK